MIERDGTMLVQLAEGDVLTYRSGAGEDAQIATVEVLKQRWVLDAYARPVLASELRWGTPGQNSITTFVDLEHGGVVVVAQACTYMEGMDCNPVGSIIWPVCAAAVGMFTPFTMIPKDAVSSSTFTVREPARSLSWEYSVETNGNLVSLTLKPGTTSRQGCDPPSHAVIDVRRGLLLEVGRPGLPTSYLESYQLADARPNGTIPPETNIPIRRAMQGVLPPGTADFEDHGFRLGDAVAVAERESDEVKTFLRQHPRTVATSAQRSGGSVTLLNAYTAEQPQWIVRLEAPNGELLTFSVTRLRPTPVSEDDRVSILPSERDAHLPASFDSIGPHIEFKAFERQMASLLGPASMAPDFTLTELAGTPAYRYFYPLGSDSSAGVTTAIEWVDYDASTGRLIQANVDRETAQAFLAPRPPAG